MILYMSGPETTGLRSTFLMGPPLTVWMVSLRGETRNLHAYDQQVGTSYGRSMQGRCQNTGNNYPVECLGVLAAFLDARADEDVCVAEDCLANVQALYKRGDWRSFGGSLLVSPKR
jgi:hypothetical protein